MSAIAAARIPVEPYAVHVPDAVLDDLRARLEATRWPEVIPGAGWSYGTDDATLRRLVDHWRTGFDWRAQEARLNRLSHHRATIDGTTVHFVHERGRGPQPLPLLLVHGWPGSVAEFLDVLGPLTDPGAHGGDPADAFDVIAPSLPGYGFSGPTTRPGVDIARCAELFSVLMREALGHERYAAQGGDWGAAVTSCLAATRPQEVAGLHLNMVAAAPHPDDRHDLTAEELEWLERLRSWRREEAGYQAIQGTRPQTLSYGLTDSPVGLAAWILEKFRAWSDCDGDVERSFTFDQLLTNITIYWATGTIGSSMRLYCEQRRSPWQLGPGARVEVPTAVASFPAEIAAPPRGWAERAYDVHRWTAMPRGGHFAAMEEPELFVEDVRAFFAPLREAG